MSENTAVVPNHLGIILDGNRRWAKDNGLSTLEGHKRGYTNLKEVAKYAYSKGVKYLSAYVFSTENWNRSKEEVDYLMNLLMWVAKTEIKELDKENIKVLFLGGNEKLSEKVLKAMNQAEERTKDNTGGILSLCLNYGGQTEIADSVRSLAQEGFNLREVTPEQIEAHLYHSEIPPVDLIIRTSGEQRISNFMLWRAAYSELYFAKMHWPAFTNKDLQDAFDDYSTRHRRFGK